MVGITIMFLQNAIEFEFIGILCCSILVYLFYRHFMFLYFSIDLFYRYFMSDVEYNLTKNI